jgi:hypothetical protein
VTQAEWDRLYGRTSDALSLAREADARLAADPSSERLQRTVRRRNLVLDALLERLDDAYRASLEES